MFKALNYFNVSLFFVGIILSFISLSMRVVLGILSHLVEHIAMNLSVWLVLCECRHIFRSLKEYSYMYWRAVSLCLLP